MGIKDDSEVERLSETKFRKNISVLQVFNGDNPFFTVSMDSEKEMARDIECAFRQAMETEDISTKVSNRVHLPNGQTLIGVHDEESCAKQQGCSVHRPSDNHMKGWSQNWRDDRGMMERICDHGIGHPDLDDVKFHGTMKDGFDFTHGCDGCCVPDRRQSVKKVTLTE